MTSDLPVFVQPADCFLQPLLFLLWQDVTQLITGLQEDAQHPLVQLAENILPTPGRRPRWKKYTHKGMRSGWRSSDPPTEEWRGLEGGYMPLTLTVCLLSSSLASPLSPRQASAFCSTFSRSCLDSSNLFLRQLLASSCLLHSPASFSKAWQQR